MKNGTRVAGTTLQSAAAFAIAVLLALLVNEAALAQDRMVSKDDFIQQLGGQEANVQPEPAAGANLPGGLRLRGPQGVRASAEAATPQPPPKPKEVAITIRFKYDSTELADEFSRRQVREAGEAFASPALRGLAFEIGGHTDGLGTDAYNLELSRKRAQAIKDALCRGYAVDCARLSVRGYGKSQPVASNDDEAGRAINRRVVFKRLE